MDTRLKSLPRGSRPDFGCVILMKQRSFTVPNSNAQDDAGSAWSAAVAGLPAWPSNWSQGVPSSLGSIGIVGGSNTGLSDFGHFNAGIRRNKYALAIWAPYPYLQAWWDEYTRYFDGTGTAPQTVSKNYVWTPPSINGLNLDITTFNAGDPTTWPLSPEYDLNETEPAAPTWPVIDQNPKTITTTLQNFRYSFLASYTPPIDGSANGFPA
jgi:hypothetical protein